MNTGTDAASRWINKNQGNSGWFISGCWCWPAWSRGWSGLLCTADSSSEGPVREAEVKHRSSVDTSSVELKKESAPPVGNRHLPHP